MAKAKIICTIGPASSKESVLRKMMLSGMDLARLNFSHGTHKEHAERIDMIRRLNGRYRRHIRILQDLEGYRIRVGRFGDKKEIPLNKNRVVILTNKKEAGTNEVIPFDYEGSLTDIKTGTDIFIDDGNILLRVIGCFRNYLKAKVLVGGMLKEHKGMNMPSVNIKFKGLKQKDRLDIEFGIKNKVDYIAQSFVRDEDDMLAVSDLVRHRLPECKFIAKIENRQGIKNIDSILKVSDGIMIARGDMGVSIPLYEIPLVQKEIIKKCNAAGKFVITATQMLETMTANIRPTRAEVTDVANAILDGTDFVMLSAESAAGLYPVEAVRMMNQIIVYTEKNSKYLKE